MSTQDTYFKMLPSRTYMTIRSISVSKKQEDSDCCFLFLLADVHSPETKQRLEAGGNVLALVDGVGL